MRAAAAQHPCLPCHHRAASQDQLGCGCRSPLMRSVPGPPWHRRNVPLTMSSRAEPALGRMWHPISPRPMPVPVAAPVRWWPKSRRFAPRRFGRGHETLSTRRWSRVVSIRGPSQIESRSAFPSPAASSLAVAQTTVQLPGPWETSHVQPSPIAALARWLPRMAAMDPIACPTAIRGTEPPPLGIGTSSHAVCRVLEPPSAVPW